MPTYPTNPALEAAVIANAEDDTPRLVYADWSRTATDCPLGCAHPPNIALNPSHSAEVEIRDVGVQRKPLTFSSRERFSGSEIRWSASTVLDGS